MVEAIDFFQEIGGKSYKVSSNISVMMLKNKVALITGSSRGIGKATALLFAKEGATVVVNYLKSKTEADEVVNMIKEIGSEAIAMQCDISDENQVKEMVDAITKKFGRIDILVNNAGIVFDIPFFEKTTKEWKRTLEVNLMGSVFCCKYVALEMKKNNAKGAIVNISSTNAINSFHPDSIDYDISKAGINMLTQDLAIELAPSIRVNAVAPGWVNTEMNANLPEEYVKKETQKIYVRRFAEPEEIAKAIVFLASDDASFITGSILKVDGGYGGWNE